MAWMAAQAITSPLVGVLYMHVFGVGSIVAMSLVSLCIALPLQVSKQRVFRPEWLMLGAAATSLVVGVGICSASARRLAAVGDGIPRAPTGGMVKLRQEAKPCFDANPAALSTM
jgi:sulfite exporter TauE/SafE